MRVEPIARGDVAAIENLSSFQLQHRLMSLQHSHTSLHQAENLSANSSSNLTNISSSVHSSSVLVLHHTANSTIAQNQTASSFGAVHSDQQRVSLAGIVQQAEASRSNATNALLAEHHAVVGDFSQGTVLARVATAESLGPVYRLVLTILILVLSCVLFKLLGRLRVSVDEGRKDEDAEACNADDEQEAEAAAQQAAAASFLEPEEEESELTFGKHMPLSYMLVGRVRDKLVLASRSADEHNDSAEELEKTCKKLIAAAKQKMDPGAQGKLASSAFNMFYLLDKRSEFLFCLAAVDPHYPDKYAFSLLHEWQMSLNHCKEARTCLKGELNDLLEERMLELFEKYKAPWGNSAAGKALVKTADIKSRMAENAATVQDVGASLEALEKQTAKMTEASEGFYRHTETAVWKHRLAKYKFYISCGIVAFDVISLWLVWFIF